MSLGGVLGGSLFYTLGYSGVFILFAVITLLTGLLLNVFKEAQQLFERREDSDGLTLRLLLTARRPFLNLFCNGVCDFFLLTLEPAFANKLKADFNFSHSQIGFFFFLFSQSI